MGRQADTDRIPRWIFENARPRACSISWFATWLAACCSRPMPTYRNPVEALIASATSEPKITVTAMTVSIRLKPRSSSWNLCVDTHEQTGFPIHGDASSTSQRNRPSGRRP